MNGFIFCKKKSNRSLFFTIIKRKNIYLFIYSTTYIEECHQNISIKIYCEVFNELG